MASKRHTLRALVMQTLFAWEFRGGDAEAILSYNLVNGGHGLEDQSFAMLLLKRLMDNREAVKDAIKHYAPEWPWDKIAPIDRAILEVGATELLFDPDMPALVAINEAIELAKEFGTESSSKFVNGVLSSLYDDRKN